MSKRVGNMVVFSLHPSDQYMSQVHGLRQMLNSFTVENLD